MPDNVRGPSLFGDSDLRALRAFVGGYLHQDFVAEYKTPATALRAYCREASRNEILELEGDLDHFITKTSDVGFGDVKETFVDELHSGWAPPNRAALARLLRILRGQVT